MSSENVEFATESLIIDNGTVYFVGRELPILYKYKMGDSKIEKLGVVPEEDVFAERQFKGICKLGDELVLIPFNAKKIWILNIKQLVWDSIDISEFLDEKMDSKFTGGYVYKNEVLIFGYMFNGILNINMDTKKISPIYISDKRLNCCAGKIANNEDFLYVARNDSSDVVEIDLKTKKVEFKNFQINTNGMSTITSYANELYVVPVRGNSYYVVSNSKISKCEIPDIFADCTYNGISVTENYIFIYSSVGRSYLVNRQDKRKSYDVSDVVYYTEVFDNNWLVVYKGEMIIYDECMREKYRVALEISEDELLELFGTRDIASRIFYEKAIFDLKMLVKTMKDR